MSRPFLVLCFHEIRDEVGEKIVVADGYQDILPSMLTISKQTFSEYMKLLEEAYILKPSEVIQYYRNEFEMPEKAVLLTFDDAFQSVKKNAYPKLKAMNYEAFMFTVSAWLFEEVSEFNLSSSQVMSFSELRSMKDVFTTANHTHQLLQRVDSRGVIQDVDREVLLNDLNECSKFVDEASVFAYPFGLYDQDVVDALPMELAFTTQVGLNDLNTPKLELYRFMAVEDMQLLRDYLSIGEPK